jgi:hypothetical protein
VRQTPSWEHFDPDGQDSAVQALTWGVTQPAPEEVFRQRAPAAQSRSWLQIVVHSLKRQTSPVLQSELCEHDMDEGAELSDEQPATPDAARASAVNIFAPKEFNANELRELLDADVPMAPRLSCRAAP